MTISSANKLRIYNGALTFIGERELSALTDVQESRRLLDSVWDRGGINTVLEEGFWNFATRATKLEYSPTVTPAFGHNRAFEKPTDYVNTAAVCTDEFFTTPLLAYEEDGTYWYASEDEIYIKYISNDSSYGTDFSLWPPSFIRYVEAYFGAAIVWKLTQNKQRRDDAHAEMLRLASKAKSKDAMKNPTKFLPPGRWRSSRGSVSNSKDRGNRSAFFG